MVVDDQTPQASARRYERPSRGAEDGPMARARRSLRPRRLAPHAPALAVYAALALVVLHGLLPHPSGREFSGVYGDEIGFEWFFTAIAHQVVHLRNPLFTPQMGAPLGVNLMGNPTLPVIAVLATPLTLALGSPAVIT